MFIGWVCSEQRFAMTKILRGKNAARQRAAGLVSNSCAAETMGTSAKVSAGGVTSIQQRVLT